MSTALVERTAHIVLRAHRLLALHADPSNVRPLYASGWGGASEGLAYWAEPKGLRVRLGRGVAEALQGNGVLVPWAEYVEVARAGLGDGRAELLTVAYRAYCDHAATQLPTNGVYPPPVHRPELGARIDAIVAEVVAAGLGKSFSIEQLCMFGGTA